ncbi:glutathione S-transferase family protein [Jiella endophytica]|uniref:Glutathione S-transferase family protein n=1 Tax=Jiella endophytica TaxID=2558362 RepID=A0A4Y8RUR6_9HYPH|nr:glutathione S-transferase family protein [Jiella endophytica]TFF27271.1 glutathione S-transferase family protein [Jiella endophytica]
MQDAIVTGFRKVPSFAEGLVRDLRVRWALNEAGIAYETAAVEVSERHSESHRRSHPFGLVPVFAADGRTMFESGAILYRIAETSPALMPEDADGRAETLTWMFAALNTMELPLNELSVLDLQHADQDWAKLRRPGAVEAVRTRLDALATWLDGRDYLTGRFSAADILMTTVLRLIGHTDLVAEYGPVKRYQTRCEARPAFRRALDEQIAGYRESAVAA